VATLALILGTRTSVQSAVRHPKFEIENSATESEGGALEQACRAEPDSWPVYVAIALSGMCALGGEVIWTRLLSLLLGGTVYTFSIILAVFLVGLGIGSSAGSMLARENVRARLALGGCQLLLAAAMAWTACMLANSLPYWPIKPALSSNPWIGFQLDLARCFWAVLPPALLWGASFPLALAAVASRGRDPGRLVGGVYAANTVGAILGAIGSSVFLIPWMGTQHSQQVLMGISAAAGGLVLTHLLWATRHSALEAEGHTQSAPPNPPPATGPCVAASTSSTKFRNISGALALLSAAAVAAWLIWRVPKVPWGLVAYGRNLAIQDADSKPLYVGEGMNSSVAVTESSGQVRNFHVSGKIEASTEPQDMRLQRMLGHIPASFHPQPKSVLIVGCGAGVTAGSFVVHPSIEKIVICEIEPLIPKVVAQHFGKENYNVVNDPRVKLVYDDARHYVLTTAEKFDIITSDPIHPWVKGAATLYTKEYFELCKNRLHPGGLVTQWVPLYESRMDVVKSEIATFFAVFPHGTIWSNDLGGEGYDVVLLGQTGPMRIDVDGLDRRLERNEAVRQSLGEVGFNTAVGLLATYGGQGPDLKPWLKDAEINRDRNLRLQFLAGLGLNASEGWAIFDQMVVHRRFPEELFIVSPGKKEALRAALEAKHSQ
jgi:spermidine synthase